MPQGRGLYLRVGALVLAGLALGIGFVLFLTASRISDNGQQFETYIRESVQGLEVGAAVRYRGVSIGRVSDIGLVSAEYRRPAGDPYGAAFQLVYVRFAVDTSRIGETTSLQEAVRLGLRVRIASQGITGVSYLELDFVDPDRFPALSVPWEPHYPYIPAIPSTVAQVQNAAEQLLQKLQGVDLPGLLDNAVGLLGDLRGQVRDGDLAVALRDAAALMRDLRGTVEKADIEGLASELRGTATALRGSAEDARQLLGSKEIAQALANAVAATAELRAAAARLPGSVNNLDASLRSARGVTADVQAELAPILRDLRVAVANLRDATEQIRRNPSQAIFGAPPPAPRESRR
ncbi:MlaD family protein [Roseicella aquatilis]|uniref:MCE family protein n=1 Tax=Roseicella aquatilis TaxID=2527868 RepID=A0A4R4DIC2_9PROT|nr:MlaD family protein [Roseicella aquatilis]TCZ60920.1 MCE family protein [Roseicella aquatilis]